MHINFIVISITFSEEKFGGITFILPFVLSFISAFSYCVNPFLTLQPNINIYWAVLFLSFMQSYPQLKKLPLKETWYETEQLLMCRTDVNGIGCAYCSIVTNIL
jgi:uncharacterized membrane protein YagU involved in acid resistance